jgi:hypothetical protein
VTILGILTMLVGVLIVVLGIVLVLASSLVAGLGLPTLGLAGGLLGGLVLIFGIVWIAVGSGLLNLRGWAWWLAIIVMVLSIIGSFGAPAAAIIPGLILVYLILVRRHFRKRLV